MILRRIIGAFCFAVMGCILQVAAFAADGDLDTAFDMDGKVTTDIKESFDYGYGVAIQMDGKIVVAGTSDNGDNYDFAVVRYNTDGTLDTSFDTDGKVITDIGGSSDHGYGVAIQTDGKIVVAGESDNGGNYDFAVVRYNANGTLDTSFDTDGKVTTDIGDTLDVASSVTIQPDGKIVVAGTSNNLSATFFAVVRYNTDGTLDTSFDADGKVTTDFEGNSGGHGVAIQTDGKIVVAGESGDGFNFDFAVVRYNTDGTLDTSFDTDGKVTTDIGEIMDFASSVAIQPDGKIVVAGSSSPVGPMYFAVVRYNTDGTLDTSFDADGKVTTDIGESSGGSGVAIQTDGKIVVAGGSNDGSTSYVAVARYNTDGTLDTSFDTDGKVTTDIGTGSSGNGVVIQPDGKIVVAGHSENGSTYDIAAVRYQSGKLTYIELIYFTGKANGDRTVTLAWETAVEIDNAGFNLYRARVKDGHYRKINITLIPAKGNATSGVTYRHVDKPRKGTYYYKLEDVDYNGVSTLHGYEKVRIRPGNTESRRSKKARR